MAHLRSKQLILLATLLFFTYSIFAQGEYIWDKEHKCKCFTYISSKNNRSFTYTGVCKDGYVSGKATVTLYIDNEKWSIYSGNFDRGLLNGQGMFEFVDAYKYEGGFVESKQHGKGKITDFRTGEIIKANFVEDELIGDVKIIYQNGDYYTGATRQKQWTIKEGKGIYHFKNGDRYEGQFATDKSESGTMYYKNGTTAKGKLLGEEHSYTFTATSSATALVKTLTPFGQPQTQQTGEPIAKLTFKNGLKIPADMKGKSGTYKFEFTNTGNKPLIIEKVGSSTYSSSNFNFTKDPIRPNEKGIIQGPIGEYSIDVAGLFEGSPKRLDVRYDDNKTVSTATTGIKSDNKTTSNSNLKPNLQAFIKKYTGHIYQVSGNTFYGWKQDIAEVSVKWTKIEVDFNGGPYPRLWIYDETDFGDIRGIRKSSQVLDLVPAYKEQELQIKNNSFGGGELFFYRKTYDQTAWAQYLRLYLFPNEQDEFIKLLQEVYKEYSCTLSIR